MDERKSLAALHGIFRQLSAEMDEFYSKGKPPPYKLLRSWWEILNLILRDYCLPENWPDVQKWGTQLPDNARPVEPLPLTLVHHLANQIDYLISGQVPVLIAPLLRRGRPEMGPHEKRDIAYGVAYVKAARRGEIADKSPMNTLAKLYGVNARTASRWVNDTLEFVEPEQFFPGADPVERARLIEQKMSEAGNAYRMAGRSAHAINLRSTKRRKRAPDTK